MTVRIKNTADDRTKHLLHRTSTRFELEPILGDKRIRLGTFIDVDDEYYERVKHLVAPWIKNGMVEVFKLQKEGDKLISAGAVAPVPAADIKLDKLVADPTITATTAASQAVSTQTLEFADSMAVTDTLTANLEPAGAPVVEEAPAPAPAVEEKSSNDAKKGPGKKKLF